MAALAWGTIRLLTTWTASGLLEQEIWGFGQVMALLLIALPFLSLSEQLFTSIGPFPCLEVGACDD